MSVEASFLPLSYPDVTFDEDGEKSITRIQESGKGIVYLSQQLQVNQKLVFRVERVNPDPIVHVLNDEEMHAMKVGLTDCDRTSLENHPYHLFEPCQQDFDCGGKSLSVLIRDAGEGDEITLERRSGGFFRVRVNAKVVFHLQDPTDSIFSLSSCGLTPFAMLSGGVEALKIVRQESNTNPELNAIQAGERIWGTCVICMEQETDHMAVPCNHAAFCSSDAVMRMNSGSRTCPICRQPITGFVRIFIS